MTSSERDAPRRIALPLTLLLAAVLAGCQATDQWCHREPHAITPEDYKDPPAPELSWFHVILQIEEMAWEARAGGQLPDDDYRQVARLCTHSASWDAGIDGEWIQEHRDAVKAAWIAARRGDWAEVLAQLTSHEKIAYAGVHPQ